MKPDYHVLVADSLDAEPSAHGTIVGVGLSIDGDRSTPLLPPSKPLTKGLGFWPPIHLLVFVRRSLKILGVQIEGKSGFVSHTKHTAEATNMDLFHS